MSKIGIMGGTFNPIHNAHLAMAEQAAGQFGLDRIFFVTSANPPHKKEQKIPDAVLRHKMVKLAIAGIPEFTACDYEIKKGGYSYTSETLAYFAKKRPGDDIYFIIGADSLHDIPTWHEPEKILKHCTLIVFARSGVSLEENIKKLSSLYSCKIKTAEYNTAEISSTEIRSRAAEGEDISKLVPPAAAEFIVRNNLYVPDVTDITERLRKALLPDRFRHTLSVASMARSLARRYKYDTQKAYRAGLLHDCAKNIDKTVMLRRCEDLEVELDEYEVQNPQLIHAKLGAAIAKYEYGECDPEILEAVALHTVGKPGMGMLAKIIFVADMIEMSRSFVGVEYLRRVAFKDIDAGVVECINMTVEYNKELGRPIHPNAYALRAKLINSDKSVRLKSIAATSGPRDK